MNCLIPARKGFIHIKTSPVPVKSCKRDLYRATPAVTQGLGLRGLIRSAALFIKSSCLASEGYWRRILIRIPTISVVAFTKTN